MCISTAGRDKGRVFVIVGECEDGLCVYVADGAMRKLAKPKRKKRKHLKMTGDRLMVIAEKLRTDQKVFDAEVWSALNNL